MTRSHAGCRGVNDSWFLDDASRRVRVSPDNGKSGDAAVSPRSGPGGWSRVERGSRYDGSMRDAPPALLGVHAARVAPGGARSVRPPALLHGGDPAHVRGRSDEGPGWRFRPIVPDR